MSDYLGVKKFTLHSSVGTALYSLYGGVMTIVSSGHHDSILLPLARQTATISPIFQVRKLRPERQVRGRE